MTNSRLAREQCEKAFAGYILASKAHPPSWSSNPNPLTSPIDVKVLIRKGQFNAQGVYEVETPEEIELPAICIAVPTVKPHDVVSYPICELHVIVMTAVDEEQATERSSARVGFISELLDDSHQVELFAALNAPTSGPDPRVIQNFRVFGMYLTEDQGQETGRRWIEQLVFEVHCNPTDDVNGNS